MPSFLCNSCVTSAGLCWHYLSSRSQNSPHHFLRGHHVEKKSKSFQGYGSSFGFFDCSFWLQKMTNLQSSPKILGTPIYACPFPSAMLTCDCKVTWLQHCKRKGETKRIKIFQIVLNKVFV